MKVQLLSIVILYFASSCGIVKVRERLVWADEFNYSGRPDSTKWKYETGDGCPELCGWGNNEAQHYASDLKNVRVENGVLVIDAIKSENQWTSGKITTQGKMKFTYGRVVFRAKLPDGNGSWAALWLLGDNVKSVGWPACGEIDVMEHVGKDPAVIHSALHTPQSHAATVNTGSKRVESYNSDFHLYEASWSEKKIDFLVDGELFYTFQPSVHNKETWPYTTPFYIIMNVAMGGNFGGPDIDPTLSLERMEVDYVRVYQ